VRDFVKCSSEGSGQQVVYAEKVGHRFLDGSIETQPFLLAPRRFGCDAFDLGSSLAEFIQSLTRLRTRHAQRQWEAA
jgi:hypothetical protein